MWSRLLWVITAITFLPMGCWSTSTYSPARPPAVPLAVRNPYLNVWLNGAKDNSGTGPVLPGSWPQHWALQNMGWQGLVRVDGTAYNWMGGHPGPSLVEQKSLTYTSTKSEFIMSVADKVQLNITFLSPVIPDDLRRQSLPFSYLTVSVQSLDGHDHQVEIYADVSGEFASGNRDDTIKWEYGANDGVIYHNFYKTSQTVFSETQEIANWGSWFWGTTPGPDVTYQSGSDRDVRSAFMRDGQLPCTVDRGYRSINRDWPVFAFARSLGQVGGSRVETTFSLGIAQDEAIHFRGNGEDMTKVPSLWKSYFSEGVDALKFFHTDYANMVRTCDLLDKRIADDSINAAGQDYLTITSLSVRQTYGALQFSGTHDKPMVFLKEISSNSDIQTVDVIFPAMPIFLYMDPKVLRYLLDPLYENQESGHYPKTSAIHDLGTFPVAKGYPDGRDEPQPLEECGNMLIMTLAYAQRSGDIQYLETHYPKLKQWTGYLIDEALIPAEQLSTDDFAGTLSNQTNLAIKGIIGLKAMSVIAGMIGADSDRLNYGNIAHSYLDQWQVLGIVNDGNRLPHTTLSYGDPNSHGLLYNLYGDKLLGLDFIPQSVYDMQSRFYPTQALRFGVPLDTRHQYTKSDWEMFVAAVASPTTRDMFISKLARWIDETPSWRAFTDLYDAANGDTTGFQFTARPVVGGHFALLALRPPMRLQVQRPS